jgi:hypothetical protein
VTDVLHSYLPQVLNDPETAADLTVDADVAALFSRLREHQVRHGVAEPPGFLRRGARKPPRDRLVGIDRARLSRAVALREDSPDVRQLCTANQLRMLDREPGASRWVRFAHHSIRADAGEARGAGSAGRGRADRPGREADRPAADQDGVAWLTTGRYAGAMRLTPLEFGAAKPMRGDADGVREGAA